MHLAGALFDARAKTTMTHVPYKGGGPAIAALLLAMRHAAACALSGT